MFFKWKNSLADELYTVSNSNEEDSYANEWNNLLFVKATNIDINYMVSYHHIHKFPYVDKKVNIVLDGEPQDLTNVKADVIITTKKERLPINTPNVYVPYFAHNLKNPKRLIKTYNEQVVSKPKFCCFMYSNCEDRFDGVVNRKRFYELMNKMTGNRVDNHGACYNNNYKNRAGIDNGNFRSNDIIYEPYKFVIAFENSQIKGYISEKLVMPMIARAIPIYLGASDVGEYFNTHSFINVSDFPSFESCIQYVMEVDKNDYLYRSIMAEPYLRPDIDIKDLFSIHYGGRVYKELYDVFKPFGLSKFIRPCNFYSNEILLITFADGIVYTSNRIVSEATESGFFKHVKAYSPVDFDPEFKLKHNDFIMKNKRGYGYWLWKSYFILKSMSELEDNDFLIWSDSGTTINYKSYERMRELYSLLETNDMIAFQNGYHELNWNKEDTIQDVLDTVNKSKYDLDMSIEQYPEQRSGAVIMMKKTSNIMNMIHLWYELCSNYHLLDDSPSILPNSQNFIEHRHDQSIFSLLSRFTPKVVIEEEVEQAELHLFDNDKVFHLTRKK
jgi:hypothetical protein